MLTHRRYLAAAAALVLIFLSSSLHESLGAALHEGRQDASTHVDQRERGIKLLEQGDTTGAIRVLQEFVKKQKTDTRAWHYLGLALSRIGKTTDARKAHEKVGKIGWQRTADLLSRISGPTAVCSSLDPSTTDLLNAAESSDKYLELSSKPSRSKISEWGERAAQLRDIANLCFALR